LFNVVAAERAGYVKPATLGIAELAARRLGVSVDLVRHLPEGDRDEETFRPLGEVLPMVSGGSATPRRRRPPHERLTCPVGGS
jgi:hypothetical protein